ncbi:decarboxylating 6-phosphogluconate dehydrogenase [Cetobacterium sp. 8H]|uniref:phosphogluconate dehydrogenase (NAD(+)-dependent, decarboxylating) n=1 Tax=Cetobacterium sp. 8H TaxID=2759681 RepID=UPI00163CDB7C|nr:decarboxylating 6-phosphogluconate dehydrogenase [Cetobacterium sp. 8H]MBC2851213.1 decarboxylating 6-phosphogluconate dehydrogenase [Cetobacterium sp. 8H]
MKIGIVGLGKMGGNIARKLLIKNHEVVGFDVDKKALNEIKKLGGVVTDSLGEFIERLNTHKNPVVWVMLPSGKITNGTLMLLKDKLKKGSIIIDAGNSNYKDSIENSEKVKSKNLNWLDIGTSGGVLGFERGYCFMVGGDEEAYTYILPILKDLSKKDGYEYIGKSGSGHFVKMIHNGIEYGMMQAYAEGFEILEKNSKYELDLSKIANLWQNGSIIESLLLDISKDIFKEDPKLENIKGYVEDSGEGRWTVEEAISERVSSPVITMALMQRFRSRQEESFSDKVIAKMRKEFGGHSVKS